MILSLVQRAKEGEKEMKVLVLLLLEHLSKCYQWSFRIYAKKPLKWERHSYWHQTLLITDLGRKRYEFYLSQIKASRH